MGFSVSKSAVFACVFFVSGTCIWSNGDANTAEALVSRARQLQALWVDGTPRLRMRAGLQVVGAKGAVAHGQYIVDWVSPSRWREEIRSGSYSRVRVHNNKGHWQKSELTFQPEVIFELDQILQFEDLLRIGPEETFGKIRSHEKDGVRQSCVEVKWRRSTDRTLCFADATGNLVSVEYSMPEHGNSLQISKIEFGDFHVVGQKRVPFEIRALRDGKNIIIATVLELAPVAEESGAGFAAPEGSEFWAKCDNMRQAKLETKVSPNYAASAVQNREQGRVIFYAVIEADGTVSHLAQIQKAGPALDAAAAEAIQQWRYEPAACGALPVRTETSIALDFWIER
jgi:TonB family protein